MPARAIYTFPQTPERVRLNPSDLRFITHSLPKSFLELRASSDDQAGEPRWRQRFVKALIESHDWVNRLSLSFKFYSFDL
jgi:hypothetical protein